MPFFEVYIPGKMVYQIQAGDGQMAKQWFADNGLPGEGDEIRFEEGEATSVDAFEAKEIQRVDVEFLVNTDDSTPDGEDNDDE